MHGPSSRYAFFRAVAICLFAAIAAPSSAFSAPELPGANQAYEFFSHNQDLREALTFFGKNVGIAVAIDPQVAGKMGDRQDGNLSREAYLEALTAEYGLVWFFDGTTLHVTVAGHVGTEIFPLKAIDGEQVIAVMDAIGIYQPKFTHRFDRKSRVLMVSGPPGYVEIVKKTVEALEEAERVDIAIVRGMSEQAMPLSPSPDLSSVFQGLGAEALQ